MILKANEECALRNHRLLERLGITAFSVMGEKYHIGAIAGDIVADIDADRFKRYDVPLEQLPLDDLDILFIENVGNLICPTDYSLGESKRAVIVSVSEGDEMVRKHPMIFKTCDLAIVNKMVDDVLRINPHVKGINDWIKFIEVSTDAHR